MCAYHAYINLKWCCKNMHFPVWLITLKSCLEKDQDMYFYIYDNKEAKLALPLNWITNYRENYTIFYVICMECS